MLRYDVKLNDDNLKRDKLVWSEKYVAPDLSFVSGVTSQHYHIDNSNMIAASIGADTNFSALNLDTENVTRNGYIIIKNKRYKIEVGIKPLQARSTEEESDDNTYKYVYIGGVYYYVTGDTVTVNNWLKEKWKKPGGGYKVEIIEGDVVGTIDSAGEYLLLDTVVWIEDDTVTIDGEKYIFDKYDEGTTVEYQDGDETKTELARYIKYYPAGRALRPSEITKCDGISSTYFNNVADYIYVTKFKLTKKDNKALEFDNLSFCTYFYFVQYKGYYCPVRKGDNGIVCEVPNRLINGDHEDYDVTLYSVKDDDDVNIDITRISQLKSYNAHIVIEGANLPVEYLLQNANYGDELAVYLTDGSHNLSVGESIVLTVETEDVYMSPVYRLSNDDGEVTCEPKESEFMLERYGLVVLKNTDESSDEEEEDDEEEEEGEETTESEEFALYKNVKYYVEENIADTTTINGVEYKVYYPNGWKEGVDALVDIDGELIPMKLVTAEEEEQQESEDEEESGGSEEETFNEKVDVARYTINKYDGIRINDTVYRVLSDGDCNKYIEMSEPTPYEFTINTIEGSSLLICTPKLNEYEFPTDFIDSICAQICEFFVTNKDNTKIVSENRSFGTRAIKSDAGFSYTDTPTSSNEFFDALENLTLFVNSGYIQIPLPLTMNVAVNGMQEDTVKRDFYEVEKAKAINPIVDMEKDVYTPKFIWNVTGVETPNDGYRGSETEFHPISKIEVNLHFRTRNNESWKINDSYNDVTAKNMDNWYCTDWYPYNELIAQKNDEGLYENAEIIRNSSDLMGMLYFTNDDVFYQRDKIAKSFLRFSYYDSPDPNTQSLLATSTVFMDEHSLYKKFIDYSRRNLYNYGLATNAPHTVKDEQGEVIKKYGNVINRISVSGECLGEHDDEMSFYEASDFENNKFKPMDKIRVDSMRLSSRLIIDNKYSTDTSAEGFYVYIFREYSENLHPKPIYMKIEFNHAGVGRTIPFIIPMKWDSHDIMDENKVYPTRRLTLSDKKTEQQPVSDLEELKKGYPLSFVYAQTYIPLYAVYDFKNKEYVYVFDTRYVDLDKDNSTVRLNLFELKVMNEDTIDEKGKDLESVRNNDILRGVIDVKF